MQLQLQNTSSKEISFYEGHQHHLGSSPFKAMQKYVCNDLKEGTDITKLGSFNWAEIIKKNEGIIINVGIQTQLVHSYFFKVLCDYLVLLCYCMLLLLNT